VSTENHNIKVYKCYKSLLEAIEEAGGSQEAILNNLRNLSANGLLDILSRNDIIFKYIGDRDEPE